MDRWQPYLISLVVGLLVGIERERAHPEQPTLGVRTFLLVSLLGAIAGGIQNAWLAALLAAFSLALIVVSYLNQTSAKNPGADRGLTTEFAAGIVFGLGYAAHEFPALSAVVGPIVALVLFSKTSLHRFTHAIQAAELKAALLLLLGGVVVVNLVPDALVDPWGIFNPRKFGYLVLTLATLEFSSYALAKLVGPKTGALVVGFLGGIASSTAVLVSSARRAERDPAGWRTPLTAAIAAKLAAFSELLLIVGLVSPELLGRVAPACAAAFLVGGCVLALVAWKNHAKDSELSLKSPLDWKGVFRLSITLGAILASVSAAKLWLGEEGTLAISLLAGSFELHGVSLANATLHAQSQLDARAAGLNVLLAVNASLVAKVALSWGIHRGAFSRALTAAFASMAAALCIVAWLTL